MLASASGTVGVTQRRWAGLLLPGTRTPGAEECYPGEQIGLPEERPARWRAWGATGNMQGAAPSGSAVAERWNGTGWHVLAVPRAAGASELNAISCTAANSCYAAGDDYQPGQPYYPDAFPLAEHWNGTAWSVQATPFVNFDGGVDNYLLGVSCVSATACEATGQYGSDNSLVAFAMGRS